MDLLSWVVFVMIFAILAGLILLIIRSTRRWQTPPADLDTTEGRTLFWIRWSRGDRG